MAGSTTSLQVRESPPTIMVCFEVNAAAGFATFLDFLADDERARVIPPPFYRYTEPLDADTIRASPVEFAERRNGAVSDYLFRVTLLLQRGDWPVDSQKDIEWQHLMPEAVRNCDLLAEKTGKRSMHDICLGRGGARVRYAQCCVL